MVSLTVLLGLCIVLFGVVGAMRGWAKELLVTSAIVLGLFINAILEAYVEPYRTSFTLQSAGTQFLIRAGLITLLAFFGYQTPHIRALQEKMAREKLEEILLGLVLGLLNGYLLAGSVWGYLHEVGYPTDLVVQPEAGSVLAMQFENLVQYLPPTLLPIPHVYFAVGVIFVLIIVVFV
ncbi:MAG: hypothetical protein A2Z14_05030 [Chloroflexi bacterium RBG_16_48_8]|nr:MAG: hypothetical protein A2Z14_05030 [Chloroflexi bacterium RBG_16_48_8]